MMQNSVLMPYLRMLNLGAFLAWWLRGLAAWLPASVRRIFSVTPTAIVLEFINNNEIVLHNEAGEDSVELGRFRLEELTTRSLREKLLKARNKTRILRLPAIKVLSKTITLPLAAEANLRQIVGFEIDRLTPFSLSKVYYDVVVLERQTSVRRIRVKFFVVQRAFVDELLEHVVKLGLTPDVIDVMGEAKIDLLPPERRPGKSRKTRQFQWALATLCLLLLLVACALPLWQQRNLVVELMPKVDAAQKQAESILALREELQRSIESSRFLLEKRQKTTFSIELLNELTAILPDGTWIEQLTIKDAEIEIRGQSLEASMLIGLVEASDMFRNVTFRSPVIADRRTGRDRFFLSAQIVNQS